MCDGRLRASSLVWTRGRGLARLRQVCPFEDGSIMNDELRKQLLRNTFVSMDFT